MLELPSFGTDTPVTLTLGAGALTFTAVSVYTKGGAAALNSFAQGNPKPLASFAFEETQDLTLHGVLSKAPGAGPFFENLGKAGQAAHDLANEAKAEGCR